MSYLSSSSSSSVSFVDPFISSLSYYSSTPLQYVTPFGAHAVDPDHHGTTMNDHNKDCFFYSSSLSSNQFVMCDNNSAAIFSTSPTSSPSSSYSGDYVDFNSSPIRRVFSTGDLQGMNGLQTSLKETSQANKTGAVPRKVGQYSAEERKERIERYRSKRHQRNFQKKITYACRKTLADSRPRVKGRFARNGENDTETETESDNSGTSYGNFGYNNNYNYNVYSQYSVLQQDCNYNYNNHTSNTGTGTSTGTGTARDWHDHQQELSYEEEVLFWPSMFDVFPTNLLS